MLIIVNGALIHVYEPGSWNLTSEDKKINTEERLSAFYFLLNSHFITISFKIFGDDEKKYIFQLDSINSEQSQNWKKCDKLPSEILLFKNRPNFKQIRLQLI